MARIRCVVRRPPSMLNRGALVFGDLRYDTQQNILSCGTRSCTLSKREGSLIELFLRNPRQTLPAARSWTGCGARERMWRTATWTIIYILPAAG